jgi:hypothetical protein
MKILAQIEKLEGGQYRFDGKIFDSFLSARREMSQWMKERKQEQQNRRSVLSREQLEVLGRSRILLR